MEFENQEPTKPVKITQQHLFILWAIATIILFVIVAWNLGWKRLEMNIYNKGVKVGVNQINALLVQQVFTNGKLQLIMPATNNQYDINGTSTKPLILVPQQ